MTPAQQATVAAAKDARLIRYRSVTYDTRFAGQLGDSSARLGRDPMGLRWPLEGSAKTTCDGSPLDEPGLPTLVSDLDSERTRTTKAEWISSFSALQRLNNRLPLAGRVISISQCSGYDVL
jgi:hypothetical protein